MKSPKVKRILSIILVFALLFTGCGAAAKAEKSVELGNAALNSLQYDIAKEHFNEAIDFDKYTIAAYEGLIRVFLEEEFLAITANPYMELPGEVAEVVYTANAVIRELSQNQGGFTSQQKQDAENYFETVSEVIQMDTDVALDTLKTGSNVLGKDNQTTVNLVGRLEEAIENLKQLGLIENVEEIKSEMEDILTSAPTEEMIAEVNKNSAGKENQTSGSGSSGGEKEVRAKALMQNIWKLYNGESVSDMKALCGEVEIFYHHPAIGAFLNESSYELVNEKDAISLTHTDSHSGDGFETNTLNSYMMSLDGTKSLVMSEGLYCVGNFQSYEIQLIYGDVINGKLEGKAEVLLVRCEDEDGIIIRRADVTFANGLLVGCENVGGCFYNTDNEVDIPGKDVGTYCVNRYVTTMECGYIQAVVDVYEDQIIVDLDSETYGSIYQHCVDFAVRIPQNIIDVTNEKEVQNTVSSETNTNEANTNETSESATNENESQLSTEVASEEEATLYGSLIWQLVNTVYSGQGNMEMFNSLIQNMNEAYPEANGGCWSAIAKYTDLKHWDTYGEDMFNSYMLKTSDYGECYILSYGAECVDNAHYDIQLIYGQMIDGQLQGEGKVLLAIKAPVLDEWVQGVVADVQFENGKVVGVSDFGGFWVNQFGQVSESETMRRDGELVDVDIISMECGEVDILVGSYSNNKQYIEAAIRTPRDIIDITDTFMAALSEN